MRQLPRLLAFLFFCALLVAAVMTFNRPQRPAQPMQPSESLQTVPARPTYPEIGAEVVEEQSQPGIAADLPADSSAAAQLPVPADQEVLAIPPQLLYSLYITDAEAGDPEAQYMVSLALGQCLVGLRTPEQMEMIISNPRISEHARETMHQRYKDCRPVAQHLAGKNPAQERQRWQKAAVDADYPVAVLQYQALRRAEDAPDAAAVKLLLARAFRDAVGKPTLETQTASLVGRYLVLHEPWRRDDITAWMMVSCDLNPGCNRAITDSYLRQAYRDHEYENIRQTADAYRGAFEQQRWEDLGLDLPLVLDD